MTLSFKKRKKSWQRNKTSYKPKSSFLPRRRNSAKLFKKVILIISIFLIAYFFFFSQFFLIKKIEIEGNKNISSSNIKEIINNNISQPILGFIPRNNFFLNKSEEIKTLLLSEFPEIKLLEVNKKFPNSLKIKITGKTPLIIWCRLDDCYYIDNNGAAFLSAEKKLLAEEDKKLIKIIEQLEIEEEQENKLEVKKEEKKNDLTYKLNAEQFEKVRLFFVGEEQSDWMATYPVLFAIAGEDLGLPVLSEISGRYISYSLDFAKEIIDDSKRIKVRSKRIEVSDNEKIFYIRINFNYENKSIFVNVIEEEEKKEEEIIFEPIKINDKVSDSDFINFVIEIDKEIKDNTLLNIKYYKTKGTKSRELIAFTDKNTRLYFDATDSSASQVKFLKDFLLNREKKEIDTLEYIYLKSGNKIFYK